MISSVTAALLRACNVLLPHFQVKFYLNCSDARALLSHDGTLARRAHNAATGLALTAAGVSKCGTTDLYHKLLALPTVVRTANKACPQRAFPALAS